MKNILEYKNNHFVIEVPKELLPEEVRIRPIKGTINNHKYKGLLTELQENVYITLSPGWMNACNLKIGDLVEVNLKILEIGLPSQKVPVEVLTKLNEKGISIDILSPSEKQQLFSSVAESRTPEIREKRIQAIINACILKHNRNNN
ncbi:hypothetical protein ABE083_06630 [Bacillus mycoides]